MKKTPASTSTYSDVQFLGYAIPTIPLDIGDVGDPNGPGFVEGRYIGLKDPAHDIDARIALVMNAVKHAAKSTSLDKASTTLKVFVVPEFSFRGTRGAYDDKPPETDYFTYFRTRFAHHVTGAEFKDWLFVIGTVVSTEQNYTRGEDPKRDLKARVREDLAIALGNVWQYANKYDDPKLADLSFKMLVDYTNYSHSDPIYEIYNRCYVLKGGTPGTTWSEGLSTEKKFISNEDFVLNLFSNIFSEEDAAYPPIAENDGEDKESAFDPLSIFVVDGVKFGVEVCLDHSRSRLRQNRKPVTELVQIQLVPSCGMQIVQQSIIACTGGLVFNCDGQYAELEPGSKPDASNSIWSRTASGKAHTQLTQVVKPCSGNDPSSGMATVTTPAGVTAHTLPITHTDASRLYAYGAGEVHIYTPAPIPAPVS